MTTPSTPSPRIGVLMGSSSDLPIMGQASDLLRELGIAHETRVISAHRDPDGMAEYARTAAPRGVQVIIAGAGGAAHLPGMVAAHSDLPVIGVPVSLRNLDGIDSLLSIAQMPRGVPVATVAIDGGANAALLAARILALTDQALALALGEQRRARTADAAEQDREVRANHPIDPTPPT